MYEQIRQDPALAGTYVIVLTAKGAQDDRQKGLLEGADDYLTKPFSPREVAERVHAVLRDRTGWQSTRPAAARDHQLAENGRSP